VLINGSCIMKQKMKKVRFGYNGHNQWSILMAPLFSKKEKEKKKLGFSIYNLCKTFKGFKDFTL